MRRSRKVDPSVSNSCAFEPAQTADYAAIRRAAGYSQARAGVESHTSQPTIRLFERAGPLGVADLKKRAAIAALYERLARRGGVAA